MVMGDKQDSILQKYSTKAREDIITLVQLNNSSINWPEIYYSFDQVSINNEPTKQQRNVDDTSCGATKVTIAESE
jgi:hypothetical protein